MNSFIKKTLVRESKKLSALPIEHNIFPVYPLEQNKTIDLYTEIENSIYLNCGFLYYNDMGAIRWHEFDWKKKSPQDGIILGSNEYEMVYKYIEEILKYIYADLNKESAHNKLFDFVSLGPGLGYEDKLILNIIKDFEPTEDRRRYFLVDISQNLIEYTINQCSDELKEINNYKSKKFDIYGINIDFNDFGNYDYKKYLDDKSEDRNRLFTIIGNTLANFQDDREFLGKIYSIMKDNDYLLIGVDSPVGIICGNKNKLTNSIKNEEILKKAYSSNLKGYHFIIGPLIDSLILDYNYIEKFYNNLAANHVGNSFFEELKKYFGPEVVKSDQYLSEFSIVHKITNDSIKDNIVRKSQSITLSISHKYNPIRFVNNIRFSFPELTVKKIYAPWDLYETKSQEMFNFPCLYLIKKEKYEDLLKEKKLESIKILVREKGINFLKQFKKLGADKDYRFEARINDIERKLNIEPSEDQKNFFILLYKYLEAIEFFQNNCNSNSVSYTDKYQDFTYLINAIQQFESVNEI